MGELSLLAFRRPSQLFSARITQRRNRDPADVGGGHRELAMLKELHESRRSQVSIKLDSTRSAGRSRAASTQLPAARALARALCFIPLRFGPV